MHTLALTSTEKTLWWWAIIVGFVVVLAVAALLTPARLPGEDHRPPRR